MTRDTLTTHQKALQVNLDASKYGTFAEIGAGQEVARWFFLVGGASGTIAKSMSAYDMVVSDAIYGSAERYVSRQRLVKMLEYEHGLLVQRLAAQRGSTTRFFAFANTVAARSYTRREEAHGWMGIRFQSEPGAEPSQILTHVRMLDAENLQQQEALGILGVNLIHAALYAAAEPREVIRALLDNLARERIEVDLIKFEGPGFAGVDNRAMGLALVEQGLTEAAMLTSGSEVVQAAEVLYKKPILVVRGSFRPITNATVDLIESARRQFSAELGVPADAVVTVTEMTLRHLAEGGVIDPADFLQRADTLALLGLNVLVSNYGRYFRLAAYLLRQTRQRVAIAMGVRRLREMFDDKYYQDLDGGLLEALGRMFKSDLKLYIYPVREAANPELVTAGSLQVAPHLRHLYAHLLGNGYIQDLRGYRPELMNVYAREVLTQIRTGDARWVEQVPAPVVRQIRERRLFGHPG